MIYETLEELPLYNWFKVQERGDLSFLLKNDKSFVERETLIDTWQKLNFEFIELFGISEDYRKIMEAKRMIDLHRYEMVINGDASFETMIDIEQAKIEAINNKHKEKANIKEVKAFVEMKYHFPIDEKTTSTRDFYTRLKLLQNGKNN